MNNYSVISEFEAFIQNSNAKPYGHISVIADGQIHRYQVEGDRAGSKNGAYCLHTDGTPNGYVMSWKDGKENKETWTYRFTDDEKREYAKKQNDPLQRAKTDKERKERERRKAEERKRQKENQERAKAMAFAEWEAAWQIEPCQHPYLKAKFEGTDLNYLDDGQFTTRYSGTPDNVDYGVITNYPPKLCRTTIKGGICKPGELLVPTSDILTGSFNSLIRIAGKPDSEGYWYKKNYAGISTNGAAFIIRPEHAKGETVYLAEGFATAFSVMVDLHCEYVVMAVASCHNFSYVCKALRAKLGNTKIIIIADNDKAGIKAAEQCVKAGLADTYTKPDIDGFDWCDDLVQRCKKGAKNNG